MCAAPEDHAKRVAILPARATDKHPAIRLRHIAAKRGHVTAPDVMLLADRRAPAVRYHPARCPRAPMRYSRCPKTARGARRPAPALRFPPFSFPPLGTPFPDSPFSARTPPKGANRRGQPHGGLHGKRRKTAEESSVFFSAVFSRRLTVAPPRRRSINPVALDPNLGVSALVGPEPAQPVQGFTRFRPFMVAAFAADSSPPKTLRGGLLLPSQQPP